MKQLKFIILFLVFISFQSCHETTLSPENDNSIKLSLSYQKKQNDPNYNAIFKGRLYGQIDSIKMKVPAMFLYGAGTKTIIRYSLPDTFVFAKSGYVAERYLGARTYNVYMMLQCLDNTEIYSNTLHITVP